MDYAGNSHKQKDAAKEQPEKVVEQVVTGEVITREKNIFKKAKGVFFGGDFKAAVQFVAADILLPGLRNMVADATKGAVDRVVYGERTRSGRTPEMRSHVNYNNPLARALQDPRSRGYLPDQPPHPYRQNRQEANEIILASKEEAESVIERLIDIVETYDVASLSDLNRLVGLASVHTDQKWGWLNLASASIRQVREGYLLDLPPLEQI